MGYREVGYVRRFAFLAWDGLARPGLMDSGLALRFMQDAYRLAWEDYGYVDV